jgi:hypothetical protein
VSKKYHEPSTFDVFVYQELGYDELFVNENEVLSHNANKNRPSYLQERSEQLDVKNAGSCSGTHARIFPLWGTRLAKPMSLGNARTLKGVLSGTGMRVLIGDVLGRMVTHADWRRGVPSGEAFVWED